VDPGPDDVTRLALAARDGDRVAARAFVRSTQADVWRLCAHLGAGSPDDLTQDTYLRAFRSLPSFRAEASARTWLLGIARRVAVDDVRAAERRRRLVGSLRSIRGANTAPDPAGAVSTRALLADLDPDRRAAFVLTQVLGLSYAEAADACGCEVGTIRSRVARARARLVDAARAADAEADAAGE
jgi:RNA polymerase sigma-70 factor (ECF subfamily)